LSKLEGNKDILINFMLDVHLSVHLSHTRWPGNVMVRAYSTLKP